MQEYDHGMLTSWEDSRTARSYLTREELYNLVWQTPMIHLSKLYGISDVGLRKICVKHDIPTPPLGYWAKRAHGKPVHQPGLPPGHAHARIHITASAGRASSPEVAAAQDAVLAEAADCPPILVPDARPRRLHRVAAATARSLRRVRTDAEGFKHGQDQEGVDTLIGPGSIDRVVRLVHALATAAEERGLAVKADREGACLVVDGLAFAWRIHEVRERKPHEPTRDELRLQAKREADHARMPSLYSLPRDRKVYRAWDHYPSGRLAMTLIDTTSRRWDRSRVIGQWRDRKGSRLEDYLDTAMTALVAGAVAVRHRLAEEAERERLRQEDLERRRREQARQERAAGRQDFLLRKAEEYQQYEKLRALSAHLAGSAQGEPNAPVDLLIAELDSLVRGMERGLERGALQEEILRLELFTDDDAVPSGST